jgi:hypothetical protein
MLFSFPFFSFSFKGRPQFRCACRVRGPIKRAGIAPSFHSAEIKIGCVANLDEPRTGVSREFEASGDERLIMHRASQDDLCADRI